MPAANLCEQCKSQTTPPHDSPSGSSNRSSARSSTIPRGGPSSSCAATSSPSKPVYVRIDPSEKTCIVLGGQGDGGCGGNKLKLNNNCIAIVGDSIIKSAKGGLQIVSGGKGKGGMQISLPGKGGCPVVQLGAGSARNCGSSASAGGMGGGVQVCPSGSGQVQLSFGKGACGRGGPSIICGPGGQNVEIFYGPQKRKLDMNHCKPTIAFMIHKRLVELETELRMAECAYSDLHPYHEPYIENLHTPRVLVGSTKRP